MTASCRPVCSSCIDLACTVLDRTIPIPELNLGSKRCSVCGLVAVVHATRNADVEIIHRIVADALEKQRQESA